MTNDKTPATLATAKHGGCVQLGDGLLPCPFCGSPAERIDFGPGSGDNEGGSCVACTRCQASGPVEFGYKETFISDWNRRALSAQPSPASSFDLEALLAACVPGGSIVDPQVIADNIRQWFAAQPSPGGQNALADAARRVLSDVDSGDYHGEISEATYAALEAALAARQPVGEPITVEAVATVRRWSNGDRYIDWLTEGGIADLEVGDVLMVSDRAITDEDGSGEVYSAPPAQVVDLGKIIEQIAQQWDGCNYDAVGETIDVGRAIRAAGKRLVDSQAVGNG